MVTQKYKYVKLYWAELLKLFHIFHLAENIWVLNFQNEKKVPKSKNLRATTSQDSGYHCGELVTWREQKWVSRNLAFFFPLSPSYLSIFSLQKSIELYTYDICTFI